MTARNIQQDQQVSPLAMFSSSAEVQSRFVTPLRTEPERSLDIAVPALEYRPTHLYESTDIMFPSPPRLPLLSSETIENSSSSRRIFLRPRFRSTTTVPLVE